MNLKKLSVSRFICVFLLLLLLSAIQTSFFRGNGFFGITPDLILAVTIAVGYFEGPFFSGITGLLGGLIIEAAGGSGICIYPLLYMLAGYFFGAMFVSSLRRGFLTVQLCTFIALTVRSTLLILKAYNVAADFNILDYLIGIWLPEILISEIFSFLIYPLVYLMNRLNRADRK